MKGDWNQNNWHSFFDAIYVINLPKRTDRREQVVKEMNLYGIPYSIWRGVENENGAKGLKETVLSIFENSIKNGYNNILVFEDDVQFLESPNAIMPYCLEQLPEEYDLLYLGCNPFQGFNEEWSMPNLLMPRHAYGLHAISYSIRAMESILFFCQRFEDVSNEPLDVIIDKIQHLNTFCSSPMIATQRPSYSDIEKRDIDWGFALQDRFNHYSQFHKK